MSAFCKAPEAQGYSCLPGGTSVTGSVLSVDTGPKMVGNLDPILCWQPQQEGRQDSCTPSRAKLIGEHSHALGEFSNALPKDPSCFLDPRKRRRKPFLSLYRCNRCQGFMDKVIALQMDSDLRGKVTKQWQNEDVIALSLCTTFVTRGAPWNTWR